MGCVHERVAEGEGRDPPLCSIKSQVIEQLTISKKHPIASPTIQLRQSTIEKMYFRFSTLLPIAALVAVVAAAPSELEARTDGVSQCNTGSMQCCTTTQTVRFPRSSRSRPLR